MPSDHIIKFAIPEMFQTLPQKALLSEMLWTEDGAQHLINQLRVYDMIRRFHVVRTGIHDEQRIKFYFENLDQYPDMRQLLFDIAQSGSFPYSAILKKNNRFMLSYMKHELEDIQNTD